LVASFGQFWGLKKDIWQLTISAKKDFGQFVVNKFIMPRGKAWIQTGDFSLRSENFGMSPEGHICNFAGRSRF